MIDEWNQGKEPELASELFCWAIIDVGVHKDCGVVDDPTRWENKRSVNTNKHCEPKLEQWRKNGYWWREPHERTDERYKREESQFEARAGHR